MTPEFLKHQVDYYSARAPEYDQWFYREGRYDYGPEFLARWQAEVATVRDQLHSGPPCQHILELAPGTGIWTSELIQLGERVTALDASDTMIAINKAKLRSDKVTYRRTDLFEWRPRREYDMVFFGFWLSHVPSDKRARFLRAAHQALKPGGRLFLVDSQVIDPTETRTGTESLGGERQRRELNDGRRFEIVKIYYEPAELTAILRDHGFDISVQATPSFFIYADGVKAS